MCKMSKKTTTNNVPAFPRQPWIYIGDPTDSSIHAKALADKLDVFCHSLDSDELFQDSGITPTEDLLARLDKCKDLRNVVVKAFMIVDHLNRHDSAKKLELATKVHAQAIKAGRNFASVNLISGEASSEDELKKWGPNHLELNVESLTSTDVVEKVYKWLFTVIPATEHIYLLKAGQLQITENKHPGYAYCPIAESENRPKDAKLQFVVVITSKPAVVPGTQQLRWSVADKSGTGSFSFQFRDTVHSRYTWAWVLALQPGDIRTLPRMSSVKITESRTIRIAKLPLRTTSFFLSSVGSTAKLLGHGLTRAGKKISMGKSSEWVPCDDVTTDAKGKMRKVNWNEKFAKENQERNDKVKKANKAISDRILGKLREAKKLKDEQYDEKASLSDKSTLGACESEKGRCGGVVEKEFC